MRPAIARYFEAEDAATTASGGNKPWPLLRFCLLRTVAFCGCSALSSVSGRRLLGDSARSPSHDIHVSTVL